MSSFQWVESYLYCEQLERLHQAFEIKSARIHQFVHWEVLMHPSYSLDIVTSMFQSLQNSRSQIKHVKYTSVSFSTKIKSRTNFLLISIR